MLDHAAPRCYLLRMRNLRLVSLLWRTGLLGGFAGALNAAHCWATLPDCKFSWHIVPAGAVHGALLALIAALFSALFYERTLAARLAVLPLMGWLAGCVSFGPLNLSLGWHWDMYAFWKKPGEAYWPFQAFGLVATAAFLGWAVFKLLRARRLLAQLLATIFAGMAGSLWWWLSMESHHWYYSLLHGTVWGSAVGLGVWSVYRERTEEGTASSDKW